MDEDESVKKRDSFGRRVTVSEKKGCVYVQDLGHEPFAFVRTVRGEAVRRIHPQKSSANHLQVVPNGFRVAVFSDNRMWLGETMVKVESDGRNDVSYRFSSLETPCMIGMWAATPTVAYTSINQSVGNLLPNGGNGALIIGVTYPNLQKEILANVSKANEYLAKIIAHPLPRKKNRRARARRSCLPTTAAEAAVVTNNRKGGKRAKLTMKAPLKAAAGPSKNYADDWFPQQHTDGPNATQSSPQLPTQPIRYEIDQNAGGLHWLDNRSNIGDLGLPRSSSLEDLDTNLKGLGNGHSPPTNTGKNSY